MRVRDDDLDAVTPIEHDDGDIGEINSIVGFHIRLAHGAVYRHFAETFAGLELTQKQVSVLWLVGDHPGIAQIEVGTRLAMDRATTMTIVNRLQERGYLRRERSNRDGRMQALFLTEQGAQARHQRCIGAGQRGEPLRARAGVDALMRQAAPGALVVGRSGTIEWLAARTDAFVDGARTQHRRAQGVAFKHARGRGHVGIGNR